MDNTYQNPYVGPRSFEEGDQGLFFGRDEESRQLTALVIAHRVVLFYAPSGTGKTSLLNASVVPELKSSKKMSMLPMSRVGGDLPPEVEDDQVDNIFIYNTLLHLMPEADTSELVNLSLVEGLRPFVEAQQGAIRLRPRLLILDQFEELFTQHPERHEDKAGFFEQMSTCLDTYPHLSLLLSMREDYIAHLDPYASQLPDRTRTRFRMERLEVKGALAAVKKPAALAGRAFEDGVAEALVDNLRRIQVGGAGKMEAGGTRLLGNYVEPVHLQIVCQQLWAGLPPGEDGIRAEDLKEFGDVDEALISFYERTLAEVQHKTGVSERHLRNWFEEKLITSARTRGLVLQGMDETEGLSQNAVQELYEAYLIRTEVRSGVVWYELSHDRLIEPILNSNADWQRSELQPFQRQAEAWNSSDRPAGLLLREEALKEAQAWASEHEEELLAFEKEFLDSSQQINERETLEREARSAKQLRRIGRLAAAETVYFVLSIVLLGGAFILISNEALVIPLITFSPLFCISGFIFGLIVLGSTLRLSRFERQPRLLKPEVEQQIDPARAQRITARAVWIERIFGLFGVLGMGWYYTRNFFTGYLIFSLYALVSLTLAGRSFLQDQLGEPLMLAVFFALNLTALTVSSSRLRDYLLENAAGTSKRYLLIGILIAALYVVSLLFIVDFIG